MDKTNKTAKKLTASVAAVIALAVCLCITTFALVYSTVAMDNNLFQTGEIKIDLNGGQPVITEHEYLFEPGVNCQTKSNRKGVQGSIVPEQNGNLRLCEAWR